MKPCELNYGILRIDRADTNIILLEGLTRHQVRPPALPRAPAPAITGPRGGHIQIDDREHRAGGANRAIMRAQQWSASQWLRGSDNIRLYRRCPNRAAGLRSQIWYGNWPPFKERHPRSSPSSTRRRQRIFERPSHPPPPSPLRFATNPGTKLHLFPSVELAGAFAERIRRESGTKWGKSFATPNGGVVNPNPGQFATPSWRWVGRRQFHRSPDDRLPDASAVHRSHTPTQRCRSRPTVVVILVSVSSPVHEIFTPCRPPPPRLPLRGTINALSACAYARGRACENARGSHHLRMSRRTAISMSLG